MTENGYVVAAPAEEALAYHRSVYPDAFNTKTHFMGEPSPQLDDYWDQSYDVIKDPKMAGRQARSTINRDSRR